VLAFWLLFVEQTQFNHAGQAVLMPENTSISWRDLATLFVAVIALIQPWLVWIWRKVFRRVSVEVYESDNIEVGYSNFGPTIGLAGTLRAKNRDTFISKMEISITRLKDNARLNLQWRFFRPNSVPLTGPITSIEPAHGFVLQPATPHVFNILFTSADFTAEHTSALNAFSEKWQRERATQLGPINEKTEAEYREAAEAAYDKFGQSVAGIEMFTQLDRPFFWQAGSYKIDLSYLGDPQPVKREYNWFFVLETKDCESLRSNTITTMRHLCGFDPYYHFSYPTWLRNLGDYKKPAS
jgi:hypothetical protein